MLKTFLRLVSRSRQIPVPVDQSSVDNIVTFAHRRELDDGYPPARLPTQGHHRDRLMSMRIEHTKLCSRDRCEQLASFGIETAGDLVTADLKSLALKFVSPRKAVGILKKYRHAIRFAATVPGMMPRDALLLISIHRRNVRGLAMESPLMLYRDLHRFAQSSAGQRLTSGRRLPSLRRIRRWISACETNLKSTQAYADAA